MSVDHPGRWLVHQAKIAVTEIPENAGWLMRKALTSRPWSTRWRRREAAPGG
jgi:hypothetical protein